MTTATRPSDAQIQAAASRILRNGPTRVVTNNEGNATTPALAGIDPDVIFIRYDGDGRFWSLGAADKHYDAAFDSWAEDWVAALNPATGGWTPCNEH